MTFADLRGGLTIAEALEAFADGCVFGAEPQKEPRRLWFPDRQSLQLRLEWVRAARARTVSEEQAELLRLAALRQQPFDAVLKWLGAPRDLTWHQ